MAGANSIFDGDKLLTTPNNERSEDLAMFEALGLKSRPAFHSGGYPAGAHSQCIPPAPPNITCDIVVALFLRKQRWILLHRQSGH